MYQQPEHSTPEIVRLANKVDFSKLTPYDVVRLQNCRSNRFFSNETYPNILPPVSKCSNVKTGVYLVNAVSQAGCDRGISREKRYDLVEMWKQTPNKEALSYYGLYTKKCQPEAIQFNQAVMKSLAKANKIPYQCKPKKDKRKERPVVPPKPQGAYVLNRCVLRCIVSKMPTVRRKASHMAANRARFCPKPEDPENPFAKDAPTFPLQVALDMAKPPPKPKHGLRRKHPYCEYQCGIPENKCTQYEWLKYKGDPKPVEKAFAKEMAEIVPIEQPEPENFDHLYAELISCFEKNQYEIPACMVYGQCCKKRTPQNPIQGCGEYQIPNECPCQNRDCEHIASKF